MLHMDQARDYPFPFQTSRGDSVMQNDLREAIAWNVTKEKYIRKWRVAQEKVLTEVADSLRGANILLRPAPGSRPTDR